MSYGDTAAAQQQLDSNGHLVLERGTHNLEGLRVSRRMHIECAVGAVVQSPTTAIVSEGSVYDVTLSGGKWRCGRWSGGSWDAAGVWQSSKYEPGAVWRHKGRSALQMAVSAVNVQKGSGFLLDAAVACLWDRKCYFRHCPAGIVHGGGGGDVGAFNANRISDCDFQFCDVGVSIGGPAGSQACGSTLRNCWFEAGRLAVAVRGNVTSLGVQGGYFESNECDMRAEGTNRQLRLEGVQFANSLAGHSRIQALDQSEVVVAGGTVRLTTGQALLESSSRYVCEVNRPTLHYVGAGRLEYTTVAKGSGVIRYTIGENDLMGSAT